ncbi:MAG: peptide ABC transporter [Magnetovibrio sp.]|nr:peptide ABC transporter [Magnetovibrio sp.]
MKIFNLILIASVLFCFNVSSNGAYARDTLIIGITQFPSSLHPNIDSMLAKSYLHGFTRRPLTVYNSAWQLQCMLCTTLPTLENGLAKKVLSPDGKSGIAVTYTIHPSARWGDGNPVSTKDVIFTWKVGRHPKSGVSNMEFYRSLYKIETVDQKTFTFYFDKITFKYNDVSNLQILPSHIDRINFTDPAKYRMKTAFDTDPTNPGLGFGPYRVVEINPGSSVVLKRNPTWYGTKPEVKKILIKVIGNTSALEANLLSGDIDMIAGELGLAIEQGVAFKKNHGEKFQILFKSGLIYEHIDLNMDNPILKDIRIRRALLYALNRSSLTKELFGGLQPVANSSVNPLDWVYSDDIPKYPYDPNLAIKLLDEAGWHIKKNGVRYNTKGKPLRLIIMSTAGNRSRELVEQVLQNYWKAVGIDVRIRNQPARVFFGQTVTERKFDSLAMFAWISSPESVPRTTLHSEHIPSIENNFSGQNYTGFRNSTMDNILESIETELNKDKRRKLWHSLQATYASKLPVLPLYFRTNTFILPKWLVGVTPTGHQHPTTLWSEYWTVIQ